jgi:hypothetical protein
MSLVLRNLVTTVEERRESSRRNNLSHFLPHTPFVAVVDLNLLELSRCSPESSNFWLSHHDERAREKHARRFSPSVHFFPFLAMVGQIHK